MECRQPVSCPWNSPGENTRVGSRSLLQGTFLTWGLNQDLLHCRWILCHLSPQGSPSLCMHTTKTVSQGLSYTETLRKKGGKYLPVINLICARHCAISVYLLFQDAPFNQSILKEISPECSLEGLMLKLKLQSFGHQMGRTDSFEKTLRLGKIEGKRRRGRERMRWHHRLNNMSLSRFWALVMDRKACHATVHEITRSWTRLSA